ncbi:MAG: COX15/CtaA family protein [Deltaproteobacteria bacterium]|nr:COX15/CtaA family protein [Deltaproteobacteria bacterium]MBW2695539.1 COX15/CtaA family protein [Deltaproteobacteria bacterium]
MSERRISASRDATRLMLARGFGLLAALTLCLIIVGSLVRAHDAGLACPDWPLCHGQVVPEFNPKIAFEWGHRAFAGTIGLGLLALTWVGARDSQLRGPLRPRLALAWVLLATQIVFGGLTVLLLLAPWTVSVHLVLGNSFCAMLLWIARDLFELEHEPRDASARYSVSARTLTVVLAACLMLQIVLGGIVSSHYAGLACTSFPSCDGESIVPTLEGLVGIHVIHRLNGFALLTLYGLLALSTRGVGRFGMLAAAGLGLVALQVGVGAANVLLMLPEPLTAMHTGVSAAIVLVTAMLVRDVAWDRGALPDSTTRARIVEVG